MAQAFLQVPHWRQPVHEASPLEMGRGAADDKHMALEAKSGWHQLLKVTLYYLINGFTSKLYFYRYAPMQLNVALLSRWGLPPQCAIKILCVLYSEFFQ